ncbi:uncharacterized protein BKA55DRAFT_546268 [Fusarium redolens]|uniref:Uncharacterized protein n=1 Tax=Fusarium redolens TaxID=48865 RepID=A0A9P9FYS4_FUSRE|nr:uncharacterized protein BKA55DRAFT_546268 [Fusarium redolens]KAH7220488.1 hypothetical protein BKA55DRAFT_546268 [Fusarium redolens]
MAAPRRRGSTMMVQTRHRRKSTRHANGIHDAAAPAQDASLTQTEAELVGEIIAEQQRLEYATERWREAADAYNFWEVEIQKINGRMRMRERLIEAENKARTVE